MGQKEAQGVFSSGTRGMFRVRAWWWFHGCVHHHPPPSVCLGTDTEHKLDLSEVGMKSRRAYLGLAFWGQDRGGVTLSAEEPLIQGG